MTYDHWKTTEPAWDAPCTICGFEGPCTRETCPNEMAEDDDLIPPGFSGDVGV